MTDMFFFNYRPISVVPCFSKIWERMMYNRLEHVLVQSHITPENQYGFRKKHSISMTFINLIPVDKITDGIENNAFNIIVFYLSKVFETILINQSRIFIALTA